MKNLLLITLLFFNICIFGQSKKIQNKTSNSIETVYKDSKEGITTVYNDLKSTAPHIKSALESLSKELKTTTDSLWLILVKQQLVWSWCFLILISSSIFNWILFYRKNYNINLKYEKVKVVNQKLFYKEGVTEEDVKNHPRLYALKYLNVQEEEIQLIPNSTISYIKHVHLIICMGLSALSIYHFSDMLTGFINPEFGALKTITEVVRNLK